MRGKNMAVIGQKEIQQENQVVFLINHTKQCGHGIFDKFCASKEHQPGVLWKPDLPGRENWSEL
jgi:hypothetical protein